MFYPFQKDHRHTTPPSDFHLPRPQLAIIENFECNQFFTFYVFVREYIKKGVLPNWSLSLYPRGL